MMKKGVVMILTMAMVLALFAGCAGTTVVYYSDCTCPADSHSVDVTTAATDAYEVTEAPALVEGAVMTGLAILPAVAATDASADAEGSADYDVTLAAVMVDDKGVIVDCAIDSVSASVSFDTTGAITSDTGAEVLTKNELGDRYGMVAYGGAVAEWYQQAEAFAQYVIGKTVMEVEEGSVDEYGYAADADLASSATINLGDFVNAVITACNNAQHLGAQAGDELILSSVSSLASSADGNAELDIDAAAVSMNGGVITSCAIDALQAKVSINPAGAASIENTMTKNELGYDYGMVAYAGASGEWFEQAAAFAEYITGKTVDEVAGIAVSEGKAAEADLASSVTISIGGFQALIAKAAQ